MEKISSKALQLILNAEGLDQPGNWPGGASGITIGIGYDLGYITVDRFESEWCDVLPFTNTASQRSNKFTRH